MEISNGGTATLDADTTHATVQLDQATVLTLSSAGFINAVGEVVGNTIIAGSINQTMGGLAGGDTLVGFSGVCDILSGLSDGLNGDTISRFGGTGSLADKIDVTDLAPTATPIYSGSSTRGTLTLNDGVHHTSITMLGDFVQSGFHIVTDSHTGSFIAYV